MNKGLALMIGAAALVLANISAAMAAPMALDVTDGGKKMMGDPVHGEVIFHRCMVCHTIQAGVNHIGPSLHGVVGRHSGIVPGFNYSAANKNSGIVWTEQKIYDYLKNPQAMVPGTKMMFPGLPAPQDRADVVSYLKQNSP
jgi:cytochrome c